MGMETTLTKTIRLKIFFPLYSDGQFVFFTALCLGLCMNGGTCMAMNNEGVCDCPVGFYGTYCENKISYCIMTACFQGTMCTSETTGFNCSFQVGTGKTLRIYFTAPEVKGRVKFCF